MTHLLNIPLLSITICLLVAAPIAQIAAMRHGPVKTEESLP